RIVVAVALASHRGLDACLGQPLGVANRKVLDPTIAVMDQPLSSLLLPLADGLFQGIEGEIAAERGRDTPAHDAATERIDHKGHVDEATPCGHIGEIRDPQRVRSLGAEVPLHQYAVPQLEWTPGRGYVEPLRGGGEWGNFAGAPMGAGCSRPPSRRSRSTASSGARLRFRGLRVSWTSAPPSCAS